MYLVLGLICLFTEPKKPKTFSDIYFSRCVWSILFTCPVFFSCGTQNGQMEISRWCTAQACGSSTGATPSSPSSTLTTPCCWCLVSTSARTTPRQGKLLSSVLVGETNSMSSGQTVIFECVFNLLLETRYRKLHVAFAREEQTVRCVWLLA